MSVVIAGYYGFGNAGDELILLALIHSLRHENSDDIITVLSNTPSETQNQFGVSAVNRWRPWTWIRPLMGARRFILGGGGLLQESTGPWNFAYYLSLLVIAKCFICQTEIVALGVDPIRRPTNRFWTRFVLNHWVDAVSVRDDASRQALMDSGVALTIDVRKDPVFDLKLERHQKNSGRIALVVSPSKGSAKWSHALAELCDLLAKQLNVSIDLLVFFAQEDEIFAREIIQNCAFEPHIRMWDHPTDVLGWIPTYDLVIATRFHALVLAASSGTPFIGWGAQPKVSALCDEYGSPYRNTDMNWDLGDQLDLIGKKYQSRNKSVILATRTA